MIECFDLNLPRMLSRLNYGEEFAETLKKKLMFCCIVDTY